jgi:hypothetical protein
MEYELMNAFDALAAYENVVAGYGVSHTEKRFK